VVVLCCAVALVLPGCTGKGSSPAPSGSADTPQRAATELAAGLTKKDVTKVEFAGAAASDVNDRLTALLAGLGPVTSTVSVGGVDSQTDTANATLKYTWTFPGVSQQWNYDATATLVDEAGRWKTRWEPTLLQPDLAAGTRLTARRLEPERGEVLGQDGVALVQRRVVVHYGIDKASVSGDAQVASARKLAKLMGVAAGSYAAKVKAAGAQAFVEAITLRADDPKRPANKTVFAIRGALPVEGEQMLAPTRDFARPILGTVGEASKEIVDASHGAVVAGDQVGLSGLQRRYDAQLRGIPGVQVRVLTTSSASPSPSASSPSASPQAARTIFEARAVPGKPLQLTLNLRQQEIAEEVLASTKPASALLAIRPSTGEVLAAANGPGTGGQSAATVGQYPPGSTFKVATSLALLRAGLTPGSKVTCPATVTVDGRRFKNYSDYPSSALGTINLRTAVAQSCNTAFIGQRGKLSGDDLAQAAASLGVGTDYDVGFPSFFGSVPPDKSATGQAAALIGQGKVQASPLAMASVVASVAAGKTVLPRLVSDKEVSPKAQPLTSAEARQLREMMGAVVAEGSGRFLGSLQPPSVIAKTGTAEYGTADPPKTHVWMIAAQADMAVAVFVGDGDSGSKTAGPLLEKYLKAVG
jgi:hypothetical protein